MIVWALFDSGNGSYTKVANEYFNDIEIYPIGIDIENKNDHFIELDLADYSYMFGNNKMYDTLNKLPRPNLIIASPPCESWSIASAMRGGMLVGNKKGVILYSIHKHHFQNSRLEDIKIMKVINSSMIDHF